MRRSGADLQRCEKLLDAGAISLGLHFHRAVIKVANAAHESERLRGPRRKPAKSDSLDEAFDDDMDARRHKLA